MPGCDPSWIGSQAFLYLPGSETRRGSPALALSGSPATVFRGSSLQMLTVETTIHLSDAAQRKPMLLFLLSGLFLLRLTERTLFSLLFHEPPRMPPGTPKLMHIWFVHNFNELIIRSFVDFSSIPPAGSRSRASARPRSGTGLWRSIGMHVSGECPVEAGPAANLL